MELYISIRSGELRLTPKNLPFKRKHALRFEWFLLLAFMRRTQRATDGWVTLAQIQKLPLWRAISKPNIGTNVGRYASALRAEGLEILDYKKLWRGPYRLALDPTAIHFDVPLSRVATSLGCSHRNERLYREKLLRFTQLYSRASILLFKGKLNPKQRRKGARLEISALAGDRSMPPDLRLLAYLTAAKVLDRLGRLEGAMKNLDDCESMVRRTENPAMKARFYLARSLHFYRAGKYKQCKESIELAASQSTGFSDLILAGAIADRRGILASANYSRKRLSRKEEQLRYEEALDFLLQGLEARLLTENYDVIQASCFNIGNTLYRMGPEYLKEAVEWIELSAKICKSMQVGRYEAIAEIMLAKFAYDSGKYKLFLRWLSEAERIVEQADNVLDRFRCFGLRALDAQRQGNLKATKQFLVQARRLYFEKPEFDWGYWDSYFERRFPEIWLNVVKEFAASNVRRRDHVR